MADGKSSCICSGNFPCSVRPLFKTSRNNGVGVMKLNLWLYSVLPAGPKLRATFEAVNVEPSGRCVESARDARDSGLPWQEILTFVVIIIVGVDSGPLGY